MSLQDWHEAAREEIPKITSCQPTEKGAVFFNALLGILQYGNPQDIQTYQPVSDNVVIGEIEPVRARLEAIDFVPHSRIDELKQESLMQFVEYINQKGLKQSTGAATHGEYAESALKKMLGIDEQIAELLYRSADNREQKLIKESYERTAKSF